MRKTIQQIESKVLYVPPLLTLTIVYIYNNLRSLFHDFPLPFSTESGIFHLHLQNQVSGLEPRNVTGDIRRARVFFYVVRSAIPQWWAGRGHRKVRRLPVTPVVPTPFSPPP